MYAIEEPAGSALISVALDGEGGVRLGTGRRLPITFQLTPDEEHVVYAADQEQDDVLDLYRVPITGGPAIRLSGPPVHETASFRVAPDASGVVYRGDDGLYWSSFTFDEDADGVLEVCDCAPADASASRVPLEVTRLRLRKHPFETILTWSRGASHDRDSLAFDVLAAETPGDFLDATCLETVNAANLFARDGLAGPPGSIRYYLVRGRNACGSGSLGRGSDSRQRPGRTCP